MYDRFFKKLVLRKRKEINIIASTELETVNSLQEQISKIDKELEKQAAERKTATPSRRKIIDENIEALTNARKEVDKDITIRMSRIKIYNNDILIDLKKLYFSLKEHQDVQAVRIDESSSTMTIYTKNIIARNMHIGEYIIQIDFNENDVTISRADGKQYKRRYQHPFVAAGNVCFGNKTNEINKAFNQGGFYSISLICIQLLKYEDLGATPYVQWADFRNWLNREK